MFNLFEIDFVIGNLCIEYDGLMFHSKGGGFPGDNSKRIKEKLINDINIKENTNYQLLTIFENEFLDIKKQKIWLSVIKNKLKINSRKIYARKCKIKLISSKNSKSFLENNHLQGNANSSVKLGLFFEEELVSLMTFGKSRYNKNIEYELIRFCSVLGTNCLNDKPRIIVNSRASPPKKAYVV